MTRVAHQVFWWLWNLSPFVRLFSRLKTEKLSLKIQENKNHSEENIKSHTEFLFIYFLFTVDYSL